MERAVCEVRALAVLPTKELAQQVGNIQTDFVLDIFIWNTKWSHNVCTHVFPHFIYTYYILLNIIYHCMFNENNLIKGGLQSCQPSSHSEDLLIFNQVANIEEKETIQNILSDINPSLNCININHGCEELSWTARSSVQVGRVFRSYAEGTSLRVVILGGQKSFGAEQVSLSEHRWAPNMDWL